MKFTLNVRREYENVIIVDYITDSQFLLYIRYHNTKRRMEGGKLLILKGAKISSFVTRESFSHIPPFTLRVQSRCSRFVC